MKMMTVPGLRIFVGAVLSAWMAIQAFSSFETSAGFRLMPSCLRGPEAVLKGFSLASRWVMFCPAVPRSAAKSYYVLIKEDGTDAVKRFDFPGRAGNSAWDPYDFDMLSMLVLRSYGLKRVGPLYQDFAKWILKRVDPDFRKKKYHVRFIREEIQIPPPDQFVTQDGLLSLPAQARVVREVQVDPSE